MSSAESLGSPTSHAPKRPVSAALWEGPASPEPLPRGPHAFDRSVVTASQRGRLIDAMASALADKGYAATTVGDVIRLAGVSRRTFYEHFSGKEECFLAAYALIDHVVDHVGLAAQGAGPEPRDQLAAGIEAYLVVMAEEPQFARMFVIEAIAAGPRALARRAEAFESFAQLLEAVLEPARIADPELPPMTAAMTRGLLGAIYELTLELLREDRSGEIPALAPEVIRLARRVCFADPC